MEHRRSQRRLARVTVDISDGRNRLSAYTRDVSRHGIFLRTEVELRERFLVQLVLHTPEGPLATTGFVVRTERGVGVGIQFFALSATAKSQWDRFISGATPQPQVDTSDLPDRATFLVKLRDVPRLEEFVERNYARGGLYMATPLLKAEGVPIALVVVHPESKEEFLIEGEVARVCRTPPKGMDVRFPVPDAVQLAMFRTFVETGETPRRAVPTTEAGSTVPNKEVPAAVPESLSEGSADIPIEIDADAASLEDSRGFDWADVSDYRSVVDFELTSPSGHSINGSSDSIDMIVDLEATQEMPIPASLLARAMPTGDTPAPPLPRPALEAEDALLVSGPSEPNAGPNSRNSWTWSTPPKGVRPVDPAWATLPAAPSRFPPARHEAAITSDLPAPPQVLDLGLEDTGSLPVEPEIPMLEPVSLLIPTLEADVPILAAEEAPVSLEAPVAAPLVALQPLPAQVAAPINCADTREAADAMAVEEIAALLDAELGPRPLPPQGPDWGKAVLAAGSPQRCLHVRCRACETDFGPAKTGRLDGPLGLVAEFKPYWSPERQKLVSVARIRSSVRRQSLATQLGGTRDRVPLQLLFEVADLGRPPVDPGDGARVRVNGVVKALLKAQDTLRDGEWVELPRTRCPSCKAADLVAKTTGLVSEADADAPAAPTE